MATIKLRIYKKWNQFKVYVPLDMYNALFNLYYNPLWYNSISSKNYIRENEVKLKVQGFKVLRNNEIGCGS